MANKKVLGVVETVVGNTTQLITNPKIPATTMLTTYLTFP